MSSSDVEDNSDKAAALEAEANRIAAATETLANRPDQFSPLGSTKWSSTNVDVESGRPIHQDFRGVWQYSDVPINKSNGVPIDPMHQTGTQPNGQATGMYGKDANVGKDWTQVSEFNPESQAIYDQGLGLMSDQMGFRSDQVQRWSDNPVDYSDIGGSNLGGTISRGDLAQFGQNQANLGAQDWRQFGTTEQTIGADDYRQFGTTDAQITGDDWRQFGTTEQTIGANDWQQQGNTEQTIGADDWRQFGSTDANLNAGSYDARFGEANADPTGGFGAHDMGGSDWDQIQYSPDAIRRQAEQETLSFMNSQLDPQWATRQSDLEQQLSNQGLQWGDAAYDKAMESMKNSRDQAYGGARNQALADSRAEANMLWGQEMQRSEQKNMQTQADVDNSYRARQSNIGNYQQVQGQEQQNYLNYMNSAFDQDYRQRQQEIDANLNYGREGFQQDFDARGQRLNAQLGFGREAFGQDLQSRQQQIDANLNYGREGFQQDLQGRQQQLDADLGYGREAFGQDLSSRQQQLDANRLYSNDAFNQDLQARQANISNYLNYGNAEFDQNLSAQELDLRARQAAEAADQGRYGLVNPGETGDILGGMLDRL